MGGAFSVLLFSSLRLGSIWVVMNGAFSDYIMLYYIMYYINIIKYTII